MRIFKLLMVLLITAFAISVASAHAPTIKRTNQSGYVKKVQSVVNIIVVSNYVLDCNKSFAQSKELNSSFSNKCEKHYNFTCKKKCYTQTNVIVDKRSRTILDPGLTSYHLLSKCYKCKQLVILKLNDSRQIRPPVDNNFS